MTVITISREIGSDGMQIAQAVATQLETTVLDKQVLAEMARQMGVAVDVVVQAEERLLAKPVVVSDEMRSFMGAQRGPAGALSEAQFIQRMTAAIKALAQPGNVVFVGRGAQMILKDEPMALHVHLYAPPQIRALRVQQRRHLPNIETAQQLVQQADEQRRNWYRRFFSGIDWKNSKHYHLMIDTARIPVEAAVKLIIQAAQVTPAVA